MTQPAPLAEILPRALKTGGIEKKVLLYDLTSRWEDLVGSLAARQSFPVKIVGKKLLIAVRGSAWANELSFLKETLLEKIHRELPHVSVEEIRFQIAD